jgi:hypothetical protein
MDPQQTNSARQSTGAGGRLRDDWEEGPAEEERSPADAFKEVGSHFSELKEYASYYLSAKADGMKASVRNLGLYAALGVVGLLAGGAIVVTSAVLLLTGLAGAIGAIFEPDKPWVGNIAVGLLILGAIGIGTMLFMKKFTAASRERTVKKYESRQQHQRVQFGHDVHERARQAEREA